MVTLEKIKCWGGEHDIYRCLWAEKANFEEGANLPCDRYCCQCCTEKNINAKRQCAKELWEEKKGIKPFF